MIKMELLNPVEDDQTEVLRPRYQETKSPKSWRVRLDGQSRPALSTRQQVMME